MQLWAPEVSLLLAACAFVGTALLAGGIEAPTTTRERTDAGGQRWAPPRMVRLSMTATAMVRLLHGFLVLLLAFAFKEVDAGLLDFGALLAAAGAGYGLASLLAPWLERRLREEPTVVSALAVLRPEISMRPAHKPALPRSVPNRHDPAHLPGWAISRRNLK